MSQVSSAVANSAQYWRIAGMSYLKYANNCAEVVRASLKEPFLTQVRSITTRVLATLCS
jgi:F-type H+-transporting ATPase subunit epsilon